MPVFLTIKSLDILNSVLAPPFGKIKTGLDKNVQNDLKYTGA